MTRRLVLNRGTARMQAVLNTAKLREETLDGRKYLVAPTTLIVSGVLAGSKGKLFYPPEELSRDPSIWDGVPLTLGHPSTNGRAISARSPAIREQFGVGNVYNVNWDDGKKRLRGEAWVDVAKAQKLRPNLLNALRSGGRVEVSTGLFTDNTPAPKGAAYNGRAYDHVARDYRADHLALLLEGSKGACSVEDGCGLNVNEQTENANPQGCNQYGCKGGGGGSRTGMSNTTDILKLRAAAASDGKYKSLKDEGDRASMKADKFHKAKMTREASVYDKLAEDSYNKADDRARELGKSKKPTKNQAQASFDDLRKALRRELNTRFGQVEVVDVFPKSVVYSRLSYGPQEADTVPRLYEVGYSADKRGKVTLDEQGAKEVQRVTTYETVSNAAVGDEATNQDGRRVGPSVFNQEEEPDMAHEPLTTNEREQLVEAMVTNCNSFGEDDREWLESQDDDRLRALAENCAEVKVLNERVGELELAVNKATKNGKGKGMPAFLKKKIAEEDDMEDEEEDDMEENSGCSKGKKKMAKNARADDDDDCECEDEEMTDNEWLENAPAGVRAVVQRAMRAEAEHKQDLVRTITANKDCKFSKEFLTNEANTREDGVEFLETMAASFVVKPKRGAPTYAGAATPSMRVENEEPLEDPMGIPEPDYAAYANVR